VATGSTGWHKDLRFYQNAFSAKMDKLRGLQNHRPEEAGGLQRVGGGPVFPGGEGDAPGGRARFSGLEPIRPAGERLAIPFAVVGVLFVADETVDPEVGDFDFEGVRAALQGIGDLPPERRMPENAEIPAVEADPSDHLDLAEVQPDFVAGRVRAIEALRVNRSAGKVADALIRMFLPRGQFVEARLFRSTAPGLEADLPCPC
jgi:hypothetical protein